MTNKYMHEIEAFAIVHFDSNEAAHQVRLSMLLEELKPLEVINEAAIVDLDSLEALKKVCAEAGINRKIEDNYSHLPFPRSDRECHSSYSVYVECESASNHDLTHGMWLDCDRAQEDLQDDLDWFLSWSPVRAIEDCENWEITDDRGFEDIDLDDFASAKNLSALAYGFQYHDSDALAAYIKENCYEDAIEAIDDFENSYHGTYASETDFAQEWAIETGYLEEMSEDNPLKDCIDWSEVAEYLEHTDYWFIWDGYTVFVFSRN